MKIINDDRLSSIARRRIVLSGDRDHLVPGIVIHTIPLMESTVFLRLGLFS